MIVRSLDVTGDWKLGRGKNDYLVDLDATAQMIETRLKSFLGDCFFDLSAGVDWFNLNGAKDIAELETVITTVILNTPNVTSASKLVLSLGTNRRFTIQYKVETIYGTITGETEQGIV